MDEASLYGRAIPHTPRIAYALAVDDAEAQAILTETLRSLRALPHDGLAARYLGSVEAFEVTGASGATYQVEVEAFWDHPRRPGGDLRVVAAIDDGRGWRSLAPLTDSFIIAPGGAFVGE
jgi:hypothetical protein